MDWEAQNPPTPTTQKDPKKQEAGRKGAEARRKKLEALKTELIAAKETVSETVPKEHAEPVVEQRVSERSEGTPGWIMGISLAVIIGAVLYTRRSAPSERRQPHIVPHEPQVVTTQSAVGQPLRSLFDM